MEFIQDMSQLHIGKHTAVTLGKFDGLHRGHQKLLSHVTERKKQGLIPALFTFDTPPMRLLSGKGGQSLLTNEERRQLAKAFGMELMVQCPFTREIAAMEPEDFIRQILVEKMHVKYIAVGTDFHFGHNRRGDVSLLCELSQTYQYEVQVLEKERYGTREISSTYAREALQEGNLRLLQELLGYPYFITGPVVHGKQLGRMLGVPTINQIPDPMKLLPANGVYASKVYCRGNSYLGMTNIGLRPTVEQAVQRNVETYIYDFNQTVYGQDCKIELYAYQRPEQKFPDVDALKAQLYEDMHEIKKIW